MKDVSRKFLTIIAIALSEISNGSLFNQRSRKQKPYPLTVAMAPQSWQWFYERQIKKHGPISDTMGLIYVI